MMAVPQRMLAAWVRYCLDTEHSWLFLTTISPNTRQPVAQASPSIACSVSTCCGLRPSRLACSICNGGQYYIVSQENSASN